MRGRQKPRERVRRPLPAVGEPQCYSSAAIQPQGAQPPTHSTRLARMGRAGFGLRVDRGAQPGRVGGISVCTNQHDLVDRPPRPLHPWKRITTTHNVEAKTQICTAFDTVVTGVSLNTNLTAPGAGRHHRGSRSRRQCAHRAHRRWAVPTQPTGTGDPPCRVHSTTYWTSA